MPPGSRRIPVAVQRAVWQRDRGQCTFVSRRGRRCPARGWLEFHHTVPFALGGETSVDNVRLLCRAHNQQQAARDFGPSNALRVREVAPPYGVILEELVPARVLADRSPAGRVRRRSLARARAPSEHHEACPG
ncbi:MAG: hypothetical protein GEU99_03615 [Luteitalea sp.]|nr:hypothetical protein [Luteitalea sp.]